MRYELLEKEGLRALKLEGPVGHPAGSETLLVSGWFWGQILGGSHPDHWVDRVPQRVREERWENHREAVSSVLLLCSLWGFLTRVLLHTLTREAAPTS